MYTKNNIGRTLNNANGVLVVCPLGLVVVERVNRRTRYSRDWKFLTSGQLNSSDLSVSAMNISVAIAMITSITQLVDAVLLLQSGTAR